MVYSYVQGDVKQKQHIKGENKRKKKGEGRRISSVEETAQGKNQVSCQRDFLPERRKR